MNLKRSGSPSMLLILGIIALGYFSAKFPSALAFTSTFSSRARNANRRDGKYQQFMSTSADAISEEIESFQKRQALKLSLLFIAKDTKRGFSATSSQRKEVAEIIKQLAQLNPTKEPAVSYYENDQAASGEPSISGKWTLAYTNAPDITSLDVSLSSASTFLPAPPSTAKLGRIGQDCDASQSTIANVIEWKRPEWLGNMINNMNGDTENSKSGDESGRVLQKVVCEAKVSPERPNIVDLKLVGFELLGQTPEDSDGGKENNLLFPWLPDFSSLLREGPAALFSKNPISLRGPLKAPFGQFEIKYLDDEMRIIKTNQGYFAVNMRESDPWF
mmetsp:Transcript_17644/g.25759  ORF Transcript_17644/g.25759 Transcript_17644/m.25759 type:complete len:331 (+) Transcript_17644:41-1033(+)